MWFISKYGFVSVVEHRDKPGSVIVRARARNDLEQLCELAEQEGIPSFGEDQIEETLGADYHYRLAAPVESWKQIACQVAEWIDYDNFKALMAKHQPERAEIYSQVWTDLMKIQFPDSDSWVDRAEVDKSESVARLYRMAADHLQSCLDAYAGDAPIPEDSLGDALDPPALPEAFNNDPVAILEHRLVQRIGMGFWQQAEGDGFDRLVSAISSANQAADLRLDEFDWASTDPTGRVNASGGVIRATENPSAFEGLDDMEMEAYPHGISTPSQRHRWDAAAAVAEKLGGGDYFIHAATRSIYNSDIPIEHLTGGSPEDSEPTGE